jgi:hypothetical protein
VPVVWQHDAKAAGKGGARGRRDAHLRQQAADRDAMDTSGAQNRVELGASKPSSLV